MSQDINEYIKKELNFLENIGLSFSMTSKMLKTGNPLESYLYKNSIVLVKVTYYKSAVNSLLQINISKNTENKCFSMEEYFLSKNIENYYSMENEDEYSYIDRIVKQFKSAVDDDLEDVLNGKVWIEVPKDYGNYK